MSLNTKFCTSIAALSNSSLTWTCVPTVSSHTTRAVIFTLIHALSVSTRLSPCCPSSALMKDLSNKITG